MIPVFLHEELGNIVPAACGIVQCIHIGLIRLSGNILIIVKPIKILMIIQSISIGVIINDAIIIMMLPQIIALLIHLLYHGNHIGDELGCRQQY